MVFAVMYASWSRTSRALKSVLTIPSSEPPGGLPPTVLGWVYARAHNHSYQDKGFVAALVSLGLRGKLIIEDKDGGVTFQRRKTEGAPADGDLPAIERFIMTAILRHRPNTVAVFYEKTRFRKATRAVRKLVFTSIPDRYFTTSSVHIVPGFIVVLVSLGVFDGLFPMDNAMRVLVAFNALNGLLFGWFSGPLLAFLIGRMPANEPWHWLGSLLGLGIAVLWAFVTYTNLQTSMDQLTGAFQASMVSSLGMGGIIGAFASIMVRPTPEGEKLLGEIEGFRAYLSGSGGNDTKLVDVSEVTVDMFERFLPHAIALGVERAWAERFERNLGATRASKHLSYAPSFYSGPSFKPGAVASSIVDIVSKLEAGYRRAKLFG